MSSPTVVFVVWAAVALCLVGSVIAAVGWWTSYGEANRTPQSFSRSSAVASGSALPPSPLP